MTRSERTGVIIAIIGLSWKSSVIAHHAEPWVVMVCSVITYVGLTIFITGRRDS